MAYSEINKYWNNDIGDKKIGSYSAGYILPVDLEDIALYRFNKELEFLNKYGRFNIDGNYLDLGCGTGNFIYEWRYKFKNLIGIDFSGPLIQMGKKRCSELRNVQFFEDNILNFEDHLDKDEKFDFIFIGGCLLYINDNDVRLLFERLFSRLSRSGVLIFREPTATKERVCENKNNYICIRRTIEEYKKLVCFDENYETNHLPNYYTYYVFLIAKYIKAFPFLKNKIFLFNNRFVEFFLLYIPLILYSKISRNMIWYNFFIIKNRL
jgi:SAM-dependent methyltransferase